MSVADSIRLFQLMRTTVGKGAVAVGVEYHGGLGGMGGKNAMVDGVKGVLARRISTREYVGIFSCECIF